VTYYLANGATGSGAYYACPNLAPGFNGLFCTDLDSGTPLAVLNPLVWVQLWGEPVFHLQNGCMAKPTGCRRIVKAQPSVNAFHATFHENTGGGFV